MTTRPIKSTDSRWAKVVVLLKQQTGASSVANVRSDEEWIYGDCYLVEAGGMRDLGVHKIPRSSVGKRILKRD